VGTRAKRLTYSASLQRDGAMLAEGREPIRPPAGWTPEHLVLAALARCALASLRHHAGRDGATVQASARADGAERGCFVDASLTVGPVYEWRAPSSKAASVTDRVTTKSEVAG